MRAAKVAALVLVAGNVSLSVGCGAPQSVARGARPPPATLSSANGRIVTEAGSYCWGELCADGVIDASTAPVLHASSGEDLRLSSAALAMASSVHASARPLSSDGRGTVLDVQQKSRDATLSAPDQLGRFEIDVLISVETGGDAGYSWIVDVR